MIQIPKLPICMAIVGTLTACAPEPPRVVYSEPVYNKYGQFVSGGEACVENPQPGRKPKPPTDSTMPQEVDREPIPPCEPDPCDESTFVPGTPPPEECDPFYRRPPGDSSENRPGGSGTSSGPDPSREPTRDPTGAPGTPGRT